jgi:uncharacterized protein YjbI with pentapeptide repeats
VLAGVGLWFNRQQREQELQTADRRAQDEALQAYVDQMSGMLIPNTEQPSLYNASPGDNLSSVARARTLTALPRLAGDRKARVVQFLYESGLIYKEHTFLNESDLIERRHNIVSLRGANLSEANLRGDNLRDANLRDANLRDANLNVADLRGAILSEAKGWTEELLAAAKSLTGATMPDGQKYEDWLKSKDREENGKNDGSP